MQHDPTARPGEREEGVLTAEAPSLRVPDVSETHGRQVGAMRARLAEHPFMLAPMAGVTDAVYREMAHERGCALAYSEMVSVAGLAYDSERTWELVEPGPGERELAVQLFGSKPEQFEPAAAMVADRLGERLALIDINMACPVPKVFKKGEGCALMGEPDVAAACLRGALAGVAGRVPVTVKIRAGIRTGEVLAPEFARRLEAEGACAVAVHGRSATQLYRGKADWGVIDAVAQAVDVPVIGSGDVMEPADAVRMLRETGASGVFVARGSYGNPWFCARAEALWKTGELPAEPTLEERLAALREHVRLYAERGNHMARLRPMVGWYVKGLPAASVWRARSMECTCEQDYERLIDDMRAACVEHGML